MVGEEPFRVKLFRVGTGGIQVQSLGKVQRLGRTERSVSGTCSWRSSGEPGHSCASGDLQS